MKTLSIILLLLSINTYAAKYKVVCESKKYGGIGINEGLAVEVQSKLNQKINSSIKSVKNVSAPSMVHEGRVFSICVTVQYLD